MKIKRIVADNVATAYRRYGAAYGEELTFSHRNAFIIAHPLVAYLVYKKQLGRNWRRRLRQCAYFEIRTCHSDSDARVANYVLSELIKYGYNIDYLQGFVNAISRTGISSADIQHICGFEDGTAVRRLCGGF